jgi:hypothetical protein
LALSSDRRDCVEEALPGELRPGGELRRDFHPFGELESDRPLLGVVDGVRHVDRQTALVEDVGDSDVLDLEARRLERARRDDDVAFFLEDPVLCLALPEVTVRVDESRIEARSTAHSFDIRRRSFCVLVATKDPTGKPVPLLVLRADPDDREALLSIGQPYFAPRAGRDRVGVLLTDDTDWEEIRALVTESYRAVAPKKLIALLD